MPMPVKFHELFEKFLKVEDEKAAAKHPLVRGRYSVGNISYIRCIHDVIRSREAPEFTLEARKKMMRGKILHPFIEEVYKSSGHQIITEHDGKKEIVYESSRVPGQTFKIVGQPDIVDLTDKCIVEIKTNGDEQFTKLKEPYESHVAQASIYAYMYGVGSIRLIYIGAGNLDDRQFDMIMDRTAVMKGIETADILFYRDTFGRLPEVIPKFLTSRYCTLCIRDIKEGTITCERGCI